MTARLSSATNPGAALVAALAERDFGRLAGTLAPDVRMRALIPPGPVELSGAELAAASFASWFGESNGLELVHSGSDEVGDRLHVFYRLRVKRPGDPWKVIEQHLFCALDEGRITALDLVCSGFRPDAAGASSTSVS
ncbi:MAG TPA: nuclear transport factor 2 family protein [Gaiellaceae bacterium]|nr:nuclear transport factor 2 family protein [Gaiellaceae bacterium]